MCKDLGPRITLVEFEVQDNAVIGYRYERGEKFFVAICCEGSEVMFEFDNHDGMEMLVNNLRTWGESEMSNYDEIYDQHKEKDPNGLKPSDPGAKLDHGKPRCALVLGGFARALTEVSKVGTYGAQKYSDNGWMSVKNGIKRYDDAQMRHMLKRHAGEAHDPDTGLHHAAHEAWNALARLELMLREESE